jgi:hypothetical protein
MSASSAPLEGVILSSRRIWRAADTHSAGQFQRCAPDPFNLAQGRFFRTEVPQDDAVVSLVRLGHRLHIEKSVPIFRVWQWAALIFPEDAVAVTGHYTISPVAQPFRKNAHCGRDDAPKASQFTQYGNHNIGTSGESFARFLHDVHRVEVMGIEAVTLQDAGSVDALQ